MVSWRQAKRRIGENGHPGASGIVTPLRKRIADVRWDASASCWD